MKGSYRTAVAFVVFASLLVYFGLRLRNSIRSIDANGSCGDHKANSAQASSRTMNFSIRSSGIRANAPTMEDTIRLVTYPDSIWGQFRAENNDRFNEILHGFETKGALAPIDLFVCDEDGAPIPDASVRLSWSTPDGLDHDKRVFGTTDTTGHFSAEERSIWSVGWRVEKEGYYTAYSNLELRTYATVQGWKKRRWFRAPFPATAVLRKKIPHEMLFRTIEERMPSAGVKIGFDLIDGKPTPPHGDGHVSDVVFYEEVGGPWGLRSTEDRFSSLHMKFPGDGNGVAKFPMDDTSDLKSPRLAPEVGYSPGIESVSRVVNGRYTEKDMIPPKEYLVVRIRCLLSDDGIVTNAIYGKLRGYWYVNGPKRLVSFRAWMNEEAGNRNLEDSSGWW